MYTNYLHHQFHLLQTREQGLFTLENLQMITVMFQLGIAIGILKVWVLRYKSIKEDFKEFGLPDWSRNVIGFTKLFLCLLLLAGIWVYELAVFSSVALFILMVGAVWAHYKARHDFKKSAEAIIVCTLSVFVAIISWKYKFVG